jgi:hypothetical protein
MTRINVVAPGALHRLHLVAEYRELPRVFGLVRAAQAKGLTPATIKAPGAYTLGAGHVKFFYDKLGWLATRHAALVEEMIVRGMRPTFTEDLLRQNSDLHRHWCGSWHPTEAAAEENLARINDRLKKILNL